ncbi:MAG: glycoside hydrolase family 38 C-terminal domain-containing protein [Arachnia sp.]
MHDQLSLMDHRTQRSLAQRILPACQHPVAQARVTWWPVTGPDGITGRGEPVPWEAARDAQRTPISLPHPWGPPWGTTWFRLEVEVPEHAPGELELHVDLGWADHSPGFQAEGLARDAEGRIIKGLHPRNHWLPVPDAAGVHVFHIEAASNPLLLGVPPFIPVSDGDMATAGTDPLYIFRSAELVRVHHDVRALAADIDVLHGLAAVLPEHSQRRWRLATAIQRALDALDTEDVPGTAAAARQELLPAMELPADADAMRITAVGHAHIDSAWLWPVRETRRKVARTLANVVNLLEEGHEFHFALPAAQHVAWLIEEHPDLFARVRVWVDRGAIVPVGGMWVEPDAVLPGGEAMCRQFLLGQRFFEDVLGRRCAGMWLPDSFGYSGALPQIAKLSGADWFLTQKISWNQVNTFPHNSFLWEGIDGTRLFTHFPAADTYNSDLSPAELDHAQRSFKEKGHANSTLVPFGYGDGGGGPTREMLGRATRMEDLSGAAHVVRQSPDDFFDAAEAELTDAEVWVGELYLELHRATSTTQCSTKRGNRRNEGLLREAETWWTMAAMAGIGEYPFDELDSCWRAVLLGQFHDILPGTSIAWVHDEITATHAAVSEQLTSLADAARQLLAGDGEQEISFNASPMARDGVPALSAAPATPAQQGGITADGDGWWLSGEHLEVRFDGAGRLVRLLDRACGRDILPPGVPAGILHLVPDFPAMWDAWDTDRFQRKQPRIIDGFDDVTTTADTLTASVGFGGSTAALTWRLSRDGRELLVDVDVDWHEHDVLLKLVLPLDLHAGEASYETQFGHIRRAIHENTSWDAQRYEVSLHRWMHVGEPGYGVAIANDASHGCDVLRTARAGGGTYTTVRPSLIRGPRFPDPEADQGRHTFAFSLRPGADIADAVEAGYRRNLSPTAVTGHPVAPLVTADGALVESLKLAEDRSGDAIVRLYEPLGARRKVTLTTRPDLTVTAVDILEDPLDSVTVTPEGDGRWSVEAHPFQILSLRLSEGI